MTEPIDLSTQLNQVEEKLATLKRLDRSFSIFGSSNHRYELNSTVSDEKIKEFEKSHNIALPHDYRCFIRFLGNGGAGPFYGLGRLENGIFGDMDSPNINYKLDLSKPFPYVNSWNLETPDESRNDKFTEEYYDQRHADGLLRLCNYGCGAFINLVVNGREYGYMWADDRVNNQGLYPSVELGNEDRLLFIDWYELWLDNSLFKIESRVNNMTNLFHLAFPVHDLNAAREFYGGVLECEEGRHSDKWVDFNLYGHQIVTHLSEIGAGVKATNHVDADHVPVPHFGIILPMDDWKALAEKLKAKGVEFIIEPKIRFAGEIGEQATMFFLDPSGNALEFKGFNDFSLVFAK